MPESKTKRQERKIDIDQELRECGFDRVLKIQTREFRKYFLPSEISLYQYLCVQTFGWNRNTVEKSFRQIRDETEMSVSTIQDASAYLLKVGLIGRERKGDSSYIYWVVKLKYPNKGNPDYENFEKMFREANENRALPKTEAVAKIERGVNAVIEQIAKELDMSKKDVISKCCKTSSFYRKYATE